LDAITDKKLFMVREENYTRMETKPQTLQVVAKVVRDGRITLPINVRQVLGIKDGDTVVLDVRKIEE